MLQSNKLDCLSITIIFNWSNVSEHCLERSLREKSSHSSKFQLKLQTYDWPKNIFTDEQPSLHIRSVGDEENIVSYRRLDDCQSHRAFHINGSEATQRSCSSMQLGPNATKRIAEQDKLECFTTENFPQMDTV